MHTKCRLHDDIDDSKHRYTSLFSKIVNPVVTKDSH